MEQAIGDGVAPIHREDLQKRVDILPFGHRHQHTVIIFALVESVDIVKIKVYDLDLRVIFPQIVPQQVHIMAPFPSHQHQFFAI